MVVTYGLCPNDIKEVNKTHNAIGTFEATLKYPLDIMSPTLIVDGSFYNINFNYVSFECGGITRYYHVSNRILNGSIMDLVLVEDVLSTFKTDALNCTGHIVRSQRGDIYLDDPYASERANNVVWTRQLSTCFESGVSYIWIVAS